jgi:PhzF family phenazine biosynthesis protein
MSTFRYVVADVFTDRPLEGNQLAVFTDARELPEERLQPFAREVNFSETVFVYAAEANAHAKIRIFTPTTEPHLSSEDRCSSRKSGSRQVPVSSPCDWSARAPASRLAG